MLKEMKVKHRWEIPEGLTFEFGGARKSIRSGQEMEDFISKNEKDLPKPTTA